MMNRELSVAIAIPAYNEAEALEEFLLEMDAAVSPVCSHLTMVVVDDRSTDDTVAVATQAGKLTTGRVVVVQQEENHGHGPTVLEGYRVALDTGADVVLQVDGDGQFLGSDLRRILLLLGDGAAAVCGVRRFRYDPWFRMVLTKGVRGYLSTVFGVPSRDANCPLRGYRADALRDLLGWIPDDALVPNLYLTVLAARHGATTVEVDVTHRVRRGASDSGTMWAAGRLAVVPMRLMKFSGQALGESWEFRRAVNAGRRPARPALPPS